jgi:hypothetical protein
MYIPALRRCLVLCFGLPMAAMMFVSGAMGQVAPVAMRAPALPSGALDLGPLPGSQAMRLTLYLAPTPERQAALESYLTAVQTPGSATYRKWLIPAAFGQQFGATADQIAAVSAFAQANGLTVESAPASGLRIMVKGTAANVEATMASAVHGVQLGQTAYYANSMAPVLPNTMVGNLLTVDGLSNLPATYPLTLATDGVAQSTSPTASGLAALSAVVEANAARVVSLSTASCLEDVDAATQAAMRLTMQQASAQGMTVLAQTGCGSRGSAGFPSVLAEVTSVAAAPWITPPATANLIELRPSWQQAMGLPADGMRHEPDLTVSSLSALTQTMESILAQQPATTDGTPVRLGNVNATFYDLAAEPGLYTQPDHVAAGTWEAATGLGLVDLDKLDKLFPHGSLSDNVSINVSNGGFVTHGGSLTFSSTVTDTSGQGNGVAPTGTVVFSTSTGVTLGSSTLSGGAASATYNQLPGGTYTVTAAYSGDGTYAANNSISTGFTVGPEIVVVTGNLAGAAPVGTMATVDVVVTAPSGVGSPTGTITVSPQGTSDTGSYTGTLAGTGATTTAAVQVAAVQGGSVTFLAQCTTTASFSCSNPGRITGSNNLGTPTMKLTAAPVPPVNGTTTNFTATVSGAGGKYPTPAGNLTFEDNGSSIGSQTLSNGNASFSDSNWSSGSHRLSAVYGGDNNYASGTATANSSAAATSTSTVLGVSPNPPVSGSTTTLTATITYTPTNGVGPSGTVTFFEDGVQIGSGTVTAAVATFSSTTLSSTTAHSFEAIYVGDSNYLTSTSQAVATAATAASVATTTTMTVLPNPPVSGTLTTLTATIAQAGSSSAPTGTVTFYEDYGILGSVTVSGGSASFTSTTLSSTVAHTFYSVYSGDSTFKTSTSPLVATSASSATVATTTTLTVLPNPPVSGSTTTLTATVAFTGSTSTPTGSMNFYEDSGLIATVPLSAGSASYASTTLSSATAHTFYALYSGDATFKTSTSPVVASAATATLTSSTTLSVLPNPPVSGTLTTLTATIAYTGTTAPTGTMSFYEDAALLQSTAVSSAAASISSTTLSSKTAHAFSAVYSGDSTFKPSTAPTVNTAATTTTATTATTVTASVSTVVAGGTVTLNATVTPSSVVNSAGPTGTVTFSSAQGILCSGAVSSNAASCPATLTTTGIQAISATYNGDSNYTTSTSVTPADVTVGSSTSAGVLTAAATPAATTYGGTVTLTSTLIPTPAITGGPVGSVTFALTGTATSMTTAALVASGTSATATSPIATPVPGAYTVTATCTSTNVTCAGLSATASLTIAKGATSTTLTASPTSPMAGQTTTFTATVAPTITPNGAAILPTGTVTFFVNSTSTVEPLNNGVAIFPTVLTATTGNFVTAVYSGDTNWLGSTSLQLIVNISPIPTTGSLTANEGSALYTANIVLTDAVSATPSATVPSPAPPSGTVTFYDLYNGQTVLLGTSNVTSLVVDSVAQLSTTGLMKGTHNITALFNGGTAYATNTTTYVVNIMDYGVSFSPETLSLTTGSGGASVATITAYNGFSGQVVLGCTPPPNTLMTCSFSPAVISGSGTSVLSVTTTAATAYGARPAPLGKATTGISLAVVSLGTLLLGLLLPGTRRRPTLLLAIVAAAVIGVSMGCTTQGIVNTNGTTGSNTGGTPQGTQLLSITTQGTDGQTTVRHNSQFQVTVQ